MKLTLPVVIQLQPTDTACGATCLQAIYQFWGDSVPLSEIIKDIPELETGGTLAVQLGCHALLRGYVATIYTYNVKVFDPSWFQTDDVDLAEKLRQQHEVKKKSSLKLATATPAYLRFLELGGDIKMQPLERDLIKQHMVANVPMLAGLSATFLYQEPRERVQKPDENGKTSVPDDLAGEPVGHFVLLSGYDELEDLIQISDPLHPNPQSPAPHYWSPIDHVAAAILLGIVTFDSNLLVVQPK